ncbi:MAG TPA: SH3 domain-containing protein [Candidatus Sulfotelmatobacter sp.]|nr:SH3 domain-containing protein [Candidatus Sulfotelmatobacter sp.]
MRRCFFMFAAVFLCAGTLFASDVTDDFSHANQLFAEGKFSEAAKAYESILNAGSVSQNLLFNAGDAEFKSGNLGRAIAAFRRAELLAPRDADVRANLDFARNQVQGVTWRQSWWESWLGSLSLNEWTALAAITFWLTFILFAVVQLRPEWKNVLRGPARGMAVAAVFFCACLMAAANVHFSDSVAVVVSPDAVTRSGPFDDAQNAFAVHDGAELAILDERNGWVQVTDGSGRTGWMKGSQVEVLPVI